MYNTPKPISTTGPYIICIGRQMGSGGRQVGKLLSQKLDMAYYDNEILSMAARHSGLSRDLFAQADEHRGFFSRMLESFTPLVGASDFYGDQYLSQEKLFALQSQAIRRAASEHSCVFIGRAADYVLRGHPRCISVFVSANLDDRIVRVMEAEQVSRSVAMRMIEVGDRQRSEFYNFYTQANWGGAETYNLQINTSTLGLEESAEIIAAFARRALSLKLSK